MEEIWKDIPECAGLYQVSNLGRVQSFYFNKSKVLKQTKMKNGYHIVTIYKNKKSRTFCVHQLVAMAFLGHNPNGHQLVVDHINDDRSDNKVENLQIVTQRFNSYKTQGTYSSEYKGVSWSKINQKWKSQILTNKKVKHIGYFDCELKAHQAYKNALKNL